MQGRKNLRHDLFWNDAGVQSQCLDVIVEAAWAVGFQVRGVSTAAGTPECGVGRLSKSIAQSDDSPRLRLLAILFQHPGITAKRFVKIEIVCRVKTVTRSFATDLSGQAIRPFVEVPGIAYRR